jgi:hypothetical protein
MEMFAAFDEKDCHQGVWACQRKQGPPQQRVDESVEHEGMRSLRIASQKLNKCIWIYLAFHLHGFRTI